MKNYDLLTISLIECNLIPLFQNKKKKTFFLLPHSPSKVGPTYFMSLEFMETARGTKSWLVNL